MSGRATLTMNRSRLASTIPAQAIARTWLGFVRLTATSTTSTADLRLTLGSPYALDDQLRPVQHGLKDRDAPFPEIAVEFADRAGNSVPMATCRPSGGGDAVGDIHRDMLRPGAVAVSSGGTGICARSRARFSAATPDATLPFRQSSSA